MKILGLGASTMEGVGDSGGGFFRRTAEHFARLDAGHTFVNQGVGGQCVLEMVERLPAAVAEHPDFVIVLLGCNDLPRAADPHPQKRTSPEIYRQRLDRIFSTLQGATNWFITSFAVDEKRTGVDPACFDRYMEQAAEAARLAGYEIWDLHRETRHRQAEFLAPDGLHYNAEGHAYMAAGVIERVSAVKIR